jgi:hypothetical protein
MAEYSILVKAILDSVDLQSQLNKIPITKIPKVKASVEKMLKLQIVK